MTKIFNSYSEFLQREDKNINGVSPEFASLYPDWEKENESNDGCWNCSRCSRCSDCSRCSRCSGCSDCSRCSGCSDCSRCSDCSGCSDCSDCSRCSDCSGCSDCSDCSRCSDCSGCSDLKNASPVEHTESNNAGFKVPVIGNIHQKVLEAVTHNGNKLKMDSWHTCDTTHCRAGWVVHLAGEQGYDLEKKTSTLFAAMQIYHKSSPDINVSPVRFFESNQEAIEDIKKCAEKEKEIAG